MVPINVSRKSCGMCSSCLSCRIAIVNIKKLNVPNFAIMFEKLPKYHPPVAKLRNQVCGSASFKLRNCDCRREKKVEKHLPNACVLPDETSQIRKYCISQKANASRVLKNTKCFKLNLVMLVHIRTWVSPVKWR